MKKKIRKKNSDLIPAFGAAPWLGQRLKAMIGEDGGQTVHGRWLKERTETHPESMERTLMLLERS